MYFGIRFFVRLYFAEHDIYKKRTPQLVVESRRSRIGGGYLLFHFRSTIGVAGFNFSVRNGKRWSPRAITTLVRLVGASQLLRNCMGEKERWKLKLSRLELTFDFAARRFFLAYSQRGFSSL